MAIPGTIPLSGTLAPFGLTDTYPITDAVYGIDGLRNVADNTERNAIPDERRREGMIVGTQGTSSYWRLKASPWVGDDTDWESFTTGSAVYTQTFATTSGVPVTITHNLNTYDFVYQVREGFEDVIVQLTRIDLNTVTVTVNSSTTLTLKINA